MVTWDSQYESWNLFYLQVQKLLYVTIPTPHQKKAWYSEDARKMHPLPTFVAMKCRSPSNLWIYYCPDVFLHTLSHLKDLA